MVTGLAKVRPDLEVTIMQGDRPYFRYGSGQWGRALFRVQLKFGNVVLQIYSLPSENVPVLVGMRELKQLQVILNCETSFAVVAGEPRVLQLTSKGHALLDLAEDIPLAPVPSRHVHFVDANLHELSMLNADIPTKDIQDWDRRRWVSETGIWVVRFRAYWPELGWGKMLSTSWHIRWNVDFHCKSKCSEVQVISARSCWELSSSIISSDPWQPVRRSRTCWRSLSKRC